MLDGRTHAQVYRNFRWRIPARFNIGTDVCDKWATGKDRTALIYIDADEKERRFTFRELKRASNRLANALRGAGVAATSRVAILLPQCPETLIAHIAVYKLGGIALPLLTLFGPVAIEYRLRDSGAKAVITDEANLPKILECRDRLPALKQIFVVGSPKGSGIADFWQAIAAARADFSAVATGPDDPAIIIYTSGTTGQPKGTLHGHRFLLGILPGFEYFHNLFPQAGDLVYSPLDWAYIGGSYDALFPALHHGVPVLAFRPPKFDPEKTLSIMAKYGVRNLMAVPTVLRMMMNAVPDPQSRFDLKLRSVTAGGETLGETLYDWSQSAFGVTLNEQYGQTECDLVIGFCAAIMPIVRGAIGKPVPGHRIEILDPDGEPVNTGELGQIAVRRPDPVMFLGYWHNDAATRAKFHDDWLLTGDFGRRDETGHIWFTGREDDLIESGGYRIGPGEIEDCLMSHPTVAAVCVLGVPDKVRGEVVKAFIVPRAGVRPDAALKEELRSYVKHRLEAHAYPRLIEFRENLPMTQSGKIRKDVLKKASLGPAASPKK